MRPHTLGVIGLGAIGGSVAWAAARQGIPRVLGYTPVPADGVAALRAGAVTELQSSPRRIVQLSDLVILAAPPAATLSLLAELADDLASRELWCTDVCSVKLPVRELAVERRLADRFAGSHPLAGTHERGFAGARPDLCRQAIVYVTPLDGGEAAAREIADFWTQVCEATTVMIDAAQHDAVLAWTSHLPQAVSSGLAVALGRLGPAGMSYGPGARDTTRLAAGSVEMWTDILLLNRASVLAAITRFDDTLAELRRGLEAADGEAVAAWLSEGAQWRRELGS